MAQQTLNDGVSFGEQRSKINSNFTELYSTKTDMSDITTAVAAHVAASDPHGVTYPLTPGGYAVDITGSELNILYRTGFYRGCGLGHAPLDNGGWWHVLSAAVDANWVKQTATAFGSGNTAGEIYERVSIAGDWTSWAKVYKGTDVYPVAASLGSGAAINGTLFTGLSDIHTAEAVHSARDFAYGTLIETSIDYTGFAGDPFLLRITGNSHGRLIPIDISVQGYIYYSTVINYGGTSLGSGISGLVALLYNGHLCFWFPPQGYWEGYDVSVITAYANKNINKIVSIQDAVMPVDATRVVELSSHIKQAAYKGDAIDGTPIGQTTPAPGSFTTLSAIGTVTSSAGYHTTSTSDTAYKLTKQGVLAAKVKITSGGLVIGVDGADGDTPIGTFSSSSGLSIVGDISSTGKLTTAGIKEDSAGSVGIGVTPSAWFEGGAIDLGSYGGLQQFASQAGVGLHSNSYRSGNGVYTYKASYSAAMYLQGVGTHAWFTAPSGTAGQPISFTQAMTLDASGNLLVGTTSGSHHTIEKAVSSGGTVFGVGYLGSSHRFNLADTGGVSGAATVYSLDKIGATGRSINAAGTINASGADYAEYERNNGLSIIKGQIVGFAADGTLTLTYDDAIRFGVKSTDPSYVGGDVWGTEDQVGKRPEQPIYTAPSYTGTQAPTEPAKPTTNEGEEVNSEADDSAYLEVLNSYQDELATYNAAQAAHKTDVEQVESAHAEALAQYEVDKAAFEERLEAARQTVDRIAYSGKVPCNVFNAVPGGYIVAAEGEGGSIIGEFVADPDFSQYKKAVGRVNKLLEDGRCEIAVIVH